MKAEGKVINVGSRIGTSEGKLYDSAGKLLAHGTTTCSDLSDPISDPLALTLGCNEAACPRPPQNNACSACRSA